MTLRRVAQVITVLLAAGCEYLASTETSSSSAVGTGGPGGMGAAGAMGWTDCSTPEGYMICGGEQNCPGELSGCVTCLDPIWAEDGHVSICVNGAVDPKDCYRCPDGDVCVQFAQVLGFDCAPFNVGVLVDNAGSPEQLRYADYGLWTGDPLPAPNSCPMVTEFTICGGNCGGCPVGRICTGRSPLHPFSFCVPENGSACTASEPCATGSGCFIFLVEPEAQPLADERGYCLPLAECQAAADQLPGGGKCVTL